MTRYTTTPFSDKVKVRSKLMSDQGHLMVTEFKITTRYDLGLYVKGWESVEEELDQIKIGAIPLTISSEGQDADCQEQNNP